MSGGSCCGAPRAHPARSPGTKPLDLDEEEGESEEAVPAAAEPDAEASRAGGGGEPSEADLAALDQTDWPAVKAEVDALRSRLNNMGAVNLVAIEEYARTQATA